jgi:VanZ family protein
MAMGYGLEVGLLYSPGRSYDLADFAADAAGVCCGVILAIPLRGAVRSLLRLQPDSSSGNID